MRRPRSPLPRCAAPAGNVWIGTHHAPGEEHARREGERERAEKDEPGALERNIERRIDFLDRRLDEYQPAERSPVDGGGPKRRLPDRLKLLAHLA